MRHTPQAVDQTISAANTNALRSDARGASVLQAIQFLGSFDFSTNPTAGTTATLTINGTAVVVTFQTTPTAANDVKIGSTATETLANLLSFVRNPNLTTTTQVQASAADELLLSYLWYQVAGTTLYVGSNNRTNVAPLTSFSGATTATSDSFTSNTMALFVNPGVVYVAGTEVYFAGGASPTVTAPTANPRVDVLTLDTSGTLAWTTGTEAASPATPAYPENKVPICELYNVVGETALYDNDDQQSGEGYILNDVRPIVGTSFDPASVGAALIPDADGTRDLGSSAKEWDHVYAKIIYQGTAPVASAKFGGDGSDGALTATTGAVNIDLGGAAFVVKNYTSISITGTGYITFTNPNAAGTLILLRSQGDVTITSTATNAIDASGMGAAAGNIATEVLDVTDHSGGNGTNGGSYNASTGVGGTGGAHGTAGAAFTSTSSIFYSTDTTRLSRRTVQLACGSGAGTSGNGGSSASGGGGTAGTSGRGGGALVIECAGALDFTGNISVAGIDGTNGTAATNAGAGGGAGGSGGSGGSCLILYNTLTTNTGTISYKGGNGGDGGNGAAGGTYDTGTNADMGGGAGGGAAAAAGGYGGLGGDGGTGGGGGNGGSNAAVAPSGGNGANGVAGAGTYGGTAGVAGSGAAGYSTVSRGSGYGQGGGGGGGGGNGGAEGWALVAQNIYFS